VIANPRIVKMVKFLVAGFPSFAVAVPLNWLLAIRLALPPAPVYAVVLVFQVTVNFFMCRWFVFERRSALSIGKQFSAFFTGIGLIRGLDWCVYVALVEALHLHPIGVQLFNVVIFAVAKFLFSERTMEGPRPPK
jgi:putative flippase GtrA